MKVANPEERTRQDLVPPLDWSGTSRYAVVRCIGRGGMGIVYEAFDQVEQRTVALKTLLRFSGAELYRFKREFRTLADLQHPNLVRLHEFVGVDPERVFFTMELVRGQDFRAYTLRLPTTESQHAPEAMTRMRAVARGIQASGARLAAAQRPPGPKTGPSGSRPNSPADLGRLRPALHQLIQGVQVLHAAGKVHRDLKPPNVLVTDEGRVVILDFGVATEVVAAAVDVPIEDEIVGTAEYMAPEQACGEAPTPASDWYSVGVLLFEALVGSPPFTGSTFEVMDAKVARDVPRPSAFVQGLPEDLDLLCSALLKADPGQRPTGKEILRLLNGGGSLGPSSTEHGKPSSEPSLVGRQSQLRRLNDAFEIVREGQPVTVRVSGGSGMGKSALTRHFVDSLSQRGEALVLQGRVYEHESVPYKAIDGLIDALSQHLKHQEQDGEPARLPRHTWALACLFPVLLRVDAIAEQPAELSDDPLRIRQLAFGALRELLEEMTARQPVVLYLDDVQWGDLDSAALVLDLVHPSQAPPILLIMAHRDGAVNASPFLRELLGSWPEGADTREVNVGLLDAEEARHLALQLLGSRTASADELATAIAEESGGSPLLLDELAQSVNPEHLSASARPRVLPTAVTLGQMVTARLAQLDEPSRRVLEIVAVSGRPLSVELLSATARVDDRLDEIVGLLRARRFIRTGRRDGRETVETSHDRIRETIIELLPAPQVRAHHRQLARALESAEQVDDAEALVDHLLAAGDEARASAHAVRAAEHAAQKLAFDRAEMLYRLALKTAPAASPEARALRWRLGEVLEWSGRSADAGRVYLEAADGAPALERSELESAAAMQLLCSGRVDEGAPVLVRSLVSVDIHAPRSALDALFWLIVYRLWQRIVGLRVLDHDAREILDRGRVRVEALYTAAFGMTFIDVIAGSCMQSRHLLEALRCGDRFQQVRALALEGGHCAPAGGPESERETALYDMAQRLAERSGRAESVAFVQACRGVGKFLHGSWKRAHEILDVAYQHIPQRRAGWQANTRIYNLYALANMGRFSQLGERLPQLLREAKQRGDLFTWVAIQAGALVPLLLAADQPELARRQLKDAMASWSQRRFLLQHWRALYWEVEIELYVGNPELASELLARDARRLRRSLLLRVQYIRGMTDFLQARCVLAAVDSASGLTRHQLRRVKRAIRSLEREQMPWTSLLASMAAAALAIAQGQRPAGIVFLRKAIEQAESADMLSHASASRLRLGALLGGDEGRQLVAQAEDELSAQGVQAPSRFVSMLLPGEW